MLALLSLVSELDSSEVPVCGSTHRHRQNIGTRYSASQSHTADLVEFLAPNKQELTQNIEAGCAQASLSIAIPFKTVTGRFGLLQSIGGNVYTELARRTNTAGAPF
jgi:hypothetical protein